MRKKDKDFECCLRHIIIYDTHGCLKINWIIFTDGRSFMVTAGLWILSFTRPTAFVCTKCVRVCFCAFLFVPLFFLSHSLQFSSATFLWWKSSRSGPYRDDLLCVWPMLRMFTSTQVCLIVRVSCSIRRVSGMELGHSACILTSTPPAILLTSYPLCLQCEACLG